MQTAVVQLLSILSHYENKDIKEAIKAWSLRQGISKKAETDVLSKQGWYEVPEIPKDREYLIIYDKIYVQSAEVKKRLLKEEKQERLRRERMRQRLSCPNCGKQLLRLYPVNTSNRDKVPGNWRSQFVCPDWKNCGYEKYSEKTIQENLKELRRL